MSVPEELRTNLPALQKGQAVFLWVAERQRLIGVLVVAAPASGSGAVGQVILTRSLCKLMVPFLAAGLAHSIMLHFSVCCASDVLPAKK